MSQSHLCVTQETWCWASIGPGGHVSAAFSAPHTLVPSDQQPHGLRLGPGDGLLSSFLLQQGSEQQTNKAPPCWPEGFLWAQTQRGWGWPPLPEPLPRDKKMQLGGVGSCGLSAGSKRRLPAGPGSAVETEEMSPVQCSLLPPPRSPEGAASRSRWVSDLGSCGLLAHA